MGLTDFSLNLVRRHKQGVKTVMELGAQNLYSKDYPHKNEGGRDFYPFACVFYKDQGIKYHCLDFGFTFEGYHGMGEEPEVQDVDLSKLSKSKKTYDLVTDFGTSEHVSGRSGHTPRAFYNACKNRHNFCKDEGTVICENPKTGHWPEHGCNYVTTNFYKELERTGAIEIIELGEHAAMGNSTTGMNVYCVYKKVGEFPKFDEFKRFTFHDC